MSNSNLERKFDIAMNEIYHRAKSEAKYTASIFFNMLSTYGGLQTAKKLINNDKQSDGYTALWEKGYLHLTVEAMVVDEVQWQSLFEPEEIEKARARLKLYDYSFGQRTRN